MPRRRGGRALFPRAEVERILNSAQAQSEEMISATSSGNLRKAQNLQKILEICRGLVAATPPIDPIADLVSEKGQQLYGARFLKRSSLLNDLHGYAEMLRIWRATFDNVSSLIAGRIAHNTEQQHSSDVAHFSRDAEIQFYRTVISRQKSEMDKLRQIISQSIPAPDLEVDHGANITGDPNVADLQPLKDWVKQIERNELAINFVETGLQISDFGRPRMIIMEQDIVQLIKSL